MFKIQKRTSRKRKSSQKPAEKCATKTRKVEGNVNMSKRLTIPPEFFNTGGIASTSNKSSSSKDSNERNDKNYGFENFHGLFDKCLNIRRSERILKRTSKKNLNDNRDKIRRSRRNLRVSIDEPIPSGRCSVPNEDFHGVFNKCLNLNSYKKADILTSQKDRNSSTSKYNNGLYNREEIKCRNSHKKSRSIFEEINQLYTRASQKSKLSCSSGEFEPSSKFCTSLFRQLNRNFVFSQKTLLVSKSKIFSEFKKVDDILSGKAKMETELSGRKREFYADTEDNDSDINWEYFSKSEWVYHTPPAQKIIPPRLEEYQLQPAIIYSTKKNTQIFELKNNLVNLSNYEGREIPVNRNIINHVVTLNRNMKMDVDLAPCSSKHVHPSQDVPTVCNNVFNFSQLQDKDPFVRVFSKPVKTSKKDSRDCTQAKRKLEEDLSQDMFSSCKLSETEDSRCYNSKKNFVPVYRKKFDFDLDQCRQKFDSGGEFSFMTNNNSNTVPTTASGFDCKFFPNSGGVDNPNIFDFNKY